MGDDFHAMLQPGPGRHDDRVSIGALRLATELTADERDIVAAMYTDDADVFDYGDVEDATPDYRDVSHAADPIGDQELAGRLGSLVSKGLVRAERYTVDEIEALDEINEEYDGLIQDDAIDPDHADVLSRQGAVYARSRAQKAVDADTEPGASLFTLTEQGREYGEFLTE